MTTKLAQKEFAVEVPDYTEEVRRRINEYVNRIDQQNKLLKSGDIDAPYFSAAVTLGLEDDANPQIYKINTPGYFYRQHYRGDWDSLGTAGVIVAAKPSAFSDESERLAYIVGSDSVVGHANNLIPILPGDSTYAYIVRNNKTIREWLFVPTVLAAALNIYKDDFVSAVGAPLKDDKSPLSITSVSGNTTKISTIFDGDWKKNFKSVCGWNVADETLDTFKFVTDDDKESFKTRRRNWILALGADPADYGY